MKPSVAYIMGWESAPYGPIFSQFHTIFFPKIWQNRMLLPPRPGGSTPPPMGNPGSTPGHVFDMILLNKINTML